MISAALGAALVGAATSIGSSIYGSIKSAKEKKAQEALLAKQKAENKRWWELKRAENYVDRPDSQAILQKQREIYDDYLKRQRGIQSVVGATGESIAQQKRAAAKGVADTARSIAADGVRYKDNAERMYRGMDNNLTAQQMNNYANHSAQIVNAASQGVSAGTSLMGIGLDKWDGKWKSTKKSDAEKVAQFKSFNDGLKNFKIGK